MRIDANSEPSRVPGVQPTRTKPQESGPGDDTLALSDSTKLISVLKQIPEVRAEKVAQARNLIQDPSYPSEAVLRKISSILADNIGPRSSPE